MIGTTCWPAVHGFALPATWIGVADRGMCRDGVGPPSLRDAQALTRFAESMALDLPRTLSPDQGHAGAIVFIIFAAFQQPERRRSPESWRAGLARSICGSIQSNTPSPPTEDVSGGEAGYRVGDTVAESAPGAERGGRFRQPSSMTRDAWRNLAGRGFCRGSRRLFRPGPNTDTESRHA